MIESLIFLQMGKFVTSQVVEGDARGIFVNEIYKANTKFFEQFQMLSYRQGIIRRLLKEDIYKFSNIDYLPGHKEQILPGPYKVAKLTLQGTQDMFRLIQDFLISYIENKNPGIPKDKIENFKRIISGSYDLIRNKLEQIVFDSE